MVDRIETRAWADHHGVWSREAGRMLGVVGEAFAALNEIRYDAPWKRPAHRTGRTR